MNDNVSIQNQKQITELQKNYAVTEVKLDNLTKDIFEIKNNHLLHINDSITTLSTTVNTNQVELTKLITNLRIKDAQHEPGNKLWEKVIEYVILGAVGMAIAFVASR